MTTTSSRPHHRAPELLIPLGIPAEHLAVFSEDEQREIALAQTCYQLRQQRLDPRIPAANNYETVSWQQLEEACRVFSGMFDFKAMPEVTLAGAMRWACVLRDLAAEADVRGQRPVMPLPYRAYLRSELDTLDALNGASDEDDERLLTPRKPRRVRRKKADVQPEAPLTPEEAEAKRRRGGRKPLNQP
jgi:hypothetical protein